MRITRPSPAPPLLLRLLLTREAKNAFRNCTVACCLASMTDDVVLGFYDVVLGFDDVVLCFDDVVLCFDDVMRSRHDVMFRFADVVLCFDVVRPEMDVTQETQRGIFRGASRCCCSFASLSFLSCKNQPARTQSKRSDFKRRSSSSCVHLAFEWLLFTRNWCWQAQQSNFSRRFALHFPSRAINSTPK